MNLKIKFRSIVQVIAEILNCYSLGDLGLIQARGKGTGRIYFCVIGAI